MKAKVQYLSREIAVSDGQAVRLHFAQSTDTPPTASTRIGSAQIDHADALQRYGHWQRPTVIISDGAYGVAGFPGDLPNVDELAEWYAPHIAGWSFFALPETTLWFWSTEVGWATVHPLLKLHGWDYRALHVWDKGIAHIAGNVNSKTIRRFPVVTEVCVQYTRAIKLQTGNGQILPMQQWLREEWMRSGLPLSKTNEACGVKNAATRKYFTQDHLWYFPPPEMMERLAQFANTYGVPSAVPYFSLDGEHDLTAESWSHMRAKWNHVHGISNVWTEPAVRGMERLKDERAKNIHTNQKPLKLMERIILASSDPEDVVWEPFGGLCTAAIAAIRNKRRCYSAELLEGFYELAIARLAREKELIDGRDVAV